LIGEDNFKVDLVELSANIGDGEFFKGVHQIPFDPGGSYSLPPGLSQ